MDFSQLSIRPGICLDSRRAVFLGGQRTLVVADLHLGYSWAHRFHGQMLPLHEVDSWKDRLRALCDTYQPARIALLGDVVHQAVPVPAVQKELSGLVEVFGAQAELILLLGNHDRRLADLPLPKDLTLRNSLLLDRFHLSHGDKPPPEDHNFELALIGHEHPAISLGDGVTSRKFPCFLVGKNVLVLPAFSLWASGTAYGSYPFMSPLARKERFQTAVTIMGSRLLSIPVS